MVTREIRAFVDRDWGSVRRSKDDYWGERIGRLGAVEGLRIADHLRQQAILYDPTWPRPDERREDLLIHVRLAELFRRAGTPRRA